LVSSEEERNRKGKGNPLPNGKGFIFPHIMPFAWNTSHPPPLAGEEVARGQSLAFDI
jgi:hypothetical protein